MTKKVNQGGKMNLIPGDIILLKYGMIYDIIRLPILLGIWILSGFRKWGDKVHVELVWDIIERGYKALSLEPPVLQVVTRLFADIGITGYRLKDRPDNMNELLWKWGNEKILHQPYIIGISTCGHIVEFYKENFGIDMVPYPNMIEDYCKKSDKFVRVI